MALAKSCPVWRRGGSVAQLPPPQPQQHHLGCPQPRSPQPVHPHSCMGYPIILSLPLWPQHPWGDSRGQPWSLSAPSHIPDPRCRSVTDPLAGGGQGALRQD